MARLFVAAFAGALVSKLHAESNDDNSAAGVMQAIQGTLLLSAVLPHDGPKPSDEVETAMQKAGSLGYKAYGVLSGIESTAGAANERLDVDSTDTAATSASQSFAQGESMLQQAESTLKEGQQMAQKARSDFMNGASPLGDPPQEPRQWSSVTSVLTQAQGKLGFVRTRLTDLKSAMKRRGVSLISVESESSTVIQDQYGNAQDTKLLDFLSHE